MPEADRRYMTKACVVQAIDELYLDSEGEDTDQHIVEEEPTHFNSRRISSPPSSARRVQTSHSPWFNSFFEHMPVRLTVDTGAEVNMIQAAHARKLGIHVTRTAQRANQADGRTPLDITGEINVTFYRGTLPLRFQALVCSNIDDTVIAGTPFLKHNKINIDLGNDIISFNDGTTFKW
jgi:hypothetical protein